MFITAEYRRGLIRTTFTATPRRGSVLAAKAVVIGAVAFAIGAVAAAVAIPLGEHVLDTNGNYIFPASTLTEVRIVAGTGALVALTAVGVLALGTILRTSAGAVTAGIVVFVLPYIIGIGHAPAGAGAHGCSDSPPPPAFSVLGATPAIRAGQLPLHPGQRLLPARPLGRPRRAVRLRRRRARASPPSCCAGETHDRRATRRVDQAAHPGRHRLAARRRRRPDRRRSAPAVAGRHHTSGPAAARTPPNSPSPASTSAKPSSPSSPSWPSPRNTAPA